MHLKQDSRTIQPKRIIFFTFIIICFIGGVLLVHLYRNTPGNSDSIVLKFNNSNLSPKFDKNIHSYSFDSLTTEFPLELLITTSKKTEILLNGEKVEHSNLIEIPINSISSESYFTLEIKYPNEKEYTRYQFNTVPDDMPHYITIGESPYEGDYYLNTYSSPSYIMKLNRKGDLLYYLKSSSQLHDFKKTITESGEIFYSYQIEDNVPKLEIHYNPGSLIILNDRYEEIKKIRMSNYDNLPDNYPVENHDTIIIDENHYILMAYQEKLVQNIPDELLTGDFGSRVVATIIQEIKNGEVIWQWDSTNFPELYLDSITDNDFTNQTTKWADYIHGNSITIDPNDNNIIASFRNTSTIMKLDRNTGQIIWKLGGKSDEFGLSPEQLFSHQHYVRITDEGTLTIFDNGNDRGYTRILELSLDEINKTLLSYTSYERDNIFSFATGSVNKIADGIYNIGWGMRQINQPTMSEIDFNTGQILFELYLDGSGNTYRAVKLK